MIKDFFKVICFFILVFFLLFIVFWYLCFYFDLLNLIKKYVFVVVKMKKKISYINFLDLYLVIIKISIKKG